MAVFQTQKNQELPNPTVLQKSEVSSKKLSKGEICVVNFKVTLRIVRVWTDFYYRVTELQSDRQSPKGTQDMGG